MNANENSDVSEKYDRLTKFLSSLKSVAVAFSGGVDSTLLLKAAHDTLGENAVAVSAQSRLVTKRESDDAREFCQKEGVRRIVVPFDEESVPGLVENPPERCYLCKKAIFGKIAEVARAENLAFVIDGTNADDAKDYRPGQRAVAELDVKSPLKETGFTKADIRAAAKALNLPVWNKPSLACLASRIPYGERISPEKLAMINAAEEFLTDRGFIEKRVRLSGKTARIEISPQDFPRIMKEETRLAVTNKFRSLGFLYVSLDLDGFRSGSLNAALTKGNTA